MADDSDAVQPRGRALVRWAFRVALAVLLVTTAAAVFTWDVTPEQECAATNTGAYPEDIDVLEQRDFPPRWVCRIEYERLPNGERSAPTEVSTRDVMPLTVATGVLGVVAVALAVVAPAAARRGRLLRVLASAGVGIAIGTVLALG